MLEKKKEEVFAKVKANFTSQRKGIEEQLDQGYECVYTEMPKSNGKVYRKCVEMVMETDKKIEYR